MIHVHELTKHYADLRRGQFVALGGDQLSRPAGADLRPAGAERGGQDHGPADPQHGACGPPAARPRSTASTCVTQPAQVRRQIGFMSANTAVYDRMTGWEMVEYFGRLHGIAAGRARRADGDALRAAEDERHPRRAGGEDVDGHEAEGVGRPGDRPRSAGADLRRGHGGARRAGGPGAAEHGGRAARSRQVHPLLHAHHARGGEALRPDRHPAPRPASWPKGRWRNCATGITSATWKSCSSS